MVGHGRGTCIIRVCNFRECYIWWPHKTRNSWNLNPSENMTHKETIARSDIFSHVNMKLQHNIFFWCPQLQLCHWLHVHVVLDLVVIGMTWYVLTLSWRWEQAASSHRIPFITSNNYEGTIKKEFTKIKLIMPPVIVITLFTNRCTMF